MDSDNRKNDAAWRKVSERTNLLEEIKRAGFFRITAKELELHSDHRQPRLMAKMDFTNQRPSLFKEHKLNILPLKRGEYVIFSDPKNHCYFKLPDSYENRMPIPFPAQCDLKSLDTLQNEICTTESDALELAFLSGLLASFSGTQSLQRTKTGRHGSNKFSIKLPDSKETLWVERSQLEVDGIYEAKDAVVLVEAKIGFTTDFHVRQLLYPYNWLKEETSKQIVSIFLCYSNGEFQLTELAVGESIGSTRLVRQEYYVIDDYVLARGDLNVLLRNLPTPTEDFSIPFPQADDMDKVLDVVRLAQRNVTEPSKLVEIFGFAARQAAYYKDAARYLGFVDRVGKLTSSGTALLSERYRINRTESVLKKMLVRPALRDSIALLERQAFHVSAVPLSEIELCISRHRPKEFSQQTLTRRANTVRNWLRWLVANCDFGG